MAAPSRANALRASLQRTLITFWRLLPVLVGVLLLATFLYARSIKLPWLPVMAHYFGVRYMVILTLAMLLFSPLQGRLTERACRRAG